MRKNEEFGNRLRALRMQRKVASAYVADRVGIARSTYTGYETQQRYPPLETLGKIAAVLNTSTDYLIGLTDNPEPKELPKNMKDYFNAIRDINWDGVPLSNEDLKPIRDILQMVTKDRLPKILEEYKEQEPEEENGK